jgi:hypothetical protein
MSSYKRRKDEIATLNKEVAVLKRELNQKGNVFFAQNKWLGYDKTFYGVVIDGKMEGLREE